MIPMVLMAGQGAGTAAGFLVYNGFYVVDMARGGGGEGVGLVGQLEVAWV